MRKRRISIICLAVTTFIMGFGIVMASPTNDFVHYLKSNGVGDYYTDIFRRITTTYEFSSEQLEEAKGELNNVITVVKEVNEQALETPKAIDITKYSEEQLGIINESYNEFLNTLGFYQISNSVVPKGVLARVFEKDTGDLVMTIRDDEVAKNWLIIRRVDDLEINIAKNAFYVLPAEVEATMDDGSKQMVSVIWDGSADTHKAGRYVFHGSVEGYPEDVILTLNIENKNSIMDKSNIASIPDIEVIINQYEEYSLPKKVEAIMNDGTTKMVEVVWDGTPDTSKWDTQNFKGTVGGYAYKVKLKLNIIKG